MNKVILPYCVLLIAQTLIADHPTVSFGGNTGAINTISAQTMHSGDFAFGFRGEYIKNKAFSNDLIESSVEVGIEDVHSIDTIQTHSLSMAYGLSDSLMLSLNLLYISRNNIRAGEEENGIAEVHHHGDAKGIGDMTALLQYKMYDMDDMQFSMLYGLKLPIGKTNVYDGNELLELDLQPGSGSWDLLAGMAWSKSFAALSLDTNLLYQYTTEGEQETILGDLLNYNASIAYTLMSAENSHHHSKLHNDLLDYGVDIFVELNGEYRKRDRIRGIENDNTGGNVLYFSMGTRLTTNKSFNAFALVSLPMIENLYGLQTDNNYKMVLGVGFSF